MLRRSLALLGALVLALLVPTTAQAYAPSEYTCTVSVGTATVGDPFVISCTGPAGNVTLTLTITSNNPAVPDSAIEIAGTASETVATTAGAASFTTTLNQAGTYTLTITDAAGVVVTSQTITAVNAASGGVSASSGLPVTGASLTYLGVAGVLLLAGVAALVGTRVARRRSAATAG